MDVVRVVCLPIALLLAALLAACSEQSPESTISRSATATSIVTRDSMTPSPSASVPEGRIAYQSCRENRVENNNIIAKGCQIVSSLADGTDVRSHLGTFDGVADFLWSPDGSHMAVTISYDPNLIVVSMNPNVEGVLSTQIVAFQPTWSPDSEMIAFVTGDDQGRTTNISVIRRDGSGLQQLTPSVQTEIRGYKAPTWSPDSDLIAYGTPSGAEIINTDGDIAYKSGAVNGDVEAVAWSPDGKAVSLFVAAPATYGPGDIYLWTLKSNVVARLTTDAKAENGANRAMSWSPDGTRILFHSTKDGDYDLYVVDTATGTIEDLTDSDQTEYEGVWSLDGSQIAFVGSTATISRQVVIMDSVTGGRTLLTHDDDVKRGPSWSRVNPVFGLPTTTP